MSFLSKLSTLRKSTPSTPIKHQPHRPEPVKDEEYSILPQNYIREEDPAVRRLKELRRQELLKKGEILKKSKPEKKSTTNRRKKDEEEGSTTETRFKRKIKTPITTSNLMPKKKPEPTKKFTFEELMKQAENNAQQKDVRKTMPSPLDKGANRASRDHSMERKHIKKVGFGGSGDRLKKNLSPSPEKSNQKPLSQSEQPAPVKIKSLKNGLAQPNERIRRQLESRKRHIRPVEEEYESDMDDFIEDDTEDIAERRRSEHGSGYDRDEIWALFNRGKRRSDYAFDDYEDDDMEANEMEILEEEERARKMARIEDKREEEWLKRHEQEKKRRRRMKE